VRRKQTDQRQKKPSNKIAIRRIAQRTRAGNNVRSLGISKSAVKRILQNAAESQAAEEQLEALAAMMKAIFDDVYASAVKYQEDGIPELTAHGELQFETAFLPDVAEWTGIYCDVLKALARYQSPKLRSIDMRAKEASEETFAWPSPEEIAKLDPQTACDLYDKMCKIGPRWARRKRTDGRQNNSPNKTAAERIGEQTSAENNASPIGISKSAAIRVLQKARRQTAKENLEALAAMVKAIYTDFYVGAVKYNEDGTPELTADGDLQFDAAFLPEISVWTGIYFNVLRALAPYQSPVLRSIDATEASEEAFQLPSTEEVSKMDINEATEIYFKAIGKSRL